MIPTIEDILTYFKNGDCTLEKAVGWIEQHQENADLRDHFAGLAMQGLMGTGATLVKHTPEGQLHVPARDGIPPLAYEYADAMLKARKP